MLVDRGMCSVAKAAGTRVKAAMRRLPGRGEGGVGLVLFPCSSSEPALLTGLEENTGNDASEKKK